MRLEDRALDFLNFQSFSERQGDRILSVVAADTQGYESGGKGHGDRRQGQGSRVRGRGQEFSVPPRGD
jgi:hypothetical protein